MITMRDRESRHLSTELTYPAAKALSNRIQQTLPNEILSKQTIQQQPTSNKESHNSKKAVHKPDNT